MQQLLASSVIAALHNTESGVQITLPLPTTPLKTEQWLTLFVSLFHFQASQADWGADRFQVVLTSLKGHPPFQCLLCIEWLCEAIWLEPIGSEQRPKIISDYLKEQGDAFL
jgi:hypothetical protein